MRARHGLRQLDAAVGQQLLQGVDYERGDGRLFRFRFDRRFDESDIRAQLILGLQQNIQGFQAVRNIFPMGVDRANGFGQTPG